MFIQELIIDGFKSYATRTVICNWDSEFNAITGLNGSGKSNILDAICFVLGLTNLSQVRAQNLQDLIYKRGQAGITKASVTVIFNNQDKKQSPMGFEAVDEITITRQVVIGGKNKFLINGHVAQNQAVANLFQSVQLNINNPHFLIMQGRITKVLNMKPPEILAMIEEAAGTRMFEEKKEKALKTILKKDQKLAEIMDLMENDIAPKLNKLKKEKADFIAFQKIEGELERLKRLVVAYDYTMTSMKLERSAGVYEKKIHRVDELTANQTLLKQQMEDSASLLQGLMKSKEKEMKKSVKFKTLHEKVNNLANQLTRMNAQYELKLKSLDEEKAKNSSNLSLKLEQSENYERSLESFKSVAAEIEVEKEAIKKQSEEVGKKESFLQTLVTGISADEGKDNGYIDQIQHLKDEKTTAASEIDQANMRIKFLSEDLKQKKASLKEVSAENKGKMQTKALFEIEVAKLQKKLDSSDGFDKNRILELKQRESELNREMKNVQDKIDAASGQLSNLDFTYTAPHKQFDHSKVKGIVANLIKLDAKSLNYSTALQVCAEGRLYFVVVDDNQVASDLLKKGQLKRKYTIIPLKQVVTPNVPAEKIDMAQALAPGRVQHALSLVGYPDEVTAAMKFVFGTTFICEDGESAKKVAYDPKIRMRCITKDGDVYDPGATITGGSSPSSNDLLKKLNNLQLLEEKYNSLKAEYESIDQELKQLESSRKAFDDFEHELNVKSAELSSLEKIIAASPYGMLVAEVERIELEIGELQEKVKDKTAQKKELEKSVKELEKEMKEFSSGKDQKLKKLEQEIEKAKKDLQKRQGQFSAKNQKYLDAKENLEMLKKEMVELDSLIESDTAAMKSLKKEASVMEKEIVDLKSDYDSFNAELEEQSASFAKFDKDMKAAETEKKKKQSELSECQLELQRIGHELDGLKGECKSNEELLKKISAEHDWIDEQKENFGKPNTVFDFAAQNPAECKKRLKQLEQEHETLRKRINVKVMNMIDRVVTKERSLKDMLATVQRDKKKIEETIDQLDTYKKEAMQRTWMKVNSDFGNIFNELLPGNTSKLEPPEGQTVTDGLQVKVCLGGVWKQSLSELSGGQRSLVALSLILSLLQFKPAPMYILDEIDAALDLSHTQNIGQLFKTRFKGSQFIVVSLKEGMFNNANVLFKAKFKDGTSVVERFVQQQQTQKQKTSKTAAANNASKSRPKADGKRRRNVVDAENDDENLSGVV